MNKTLTQRKRTRRLTQCHENSEHIWYYYNNENNPCGCNSNCYHYEYDLTNNKIYEICNACGRDIHELKEEYVEEKICNGQWLLKNI